GAPRAPRLAVRAPVDVRLSREDRWVHGWTVNLSQSGVLFALRGPAVANDELEFVIRLSEGVLLPPGAGLLTDLHGHGTVVRRGAGPAGVVFFAANIRRQDVHPKVNRPWHPA